ncbi:MAG: SAM-dependent methyltransferase [Betaproteobacteria bacterium]
MTLYAIPTPLGASAEASLPVAALDTVRTLEHFVAEDAKAARAFLAAVGMAKPLREIHITTLNEHTSAAAVSDLLKPLRDGRSLGLISEAGCPAIADPGALVVDAAHAEGFRVVPLVGPSSITLALMASGLQGQRFAFCGYLPREGAERARRIRELEGRSLREDETEIFIETPYRNEALLQALLETCKPATRLCVAADLTLPSETIVSRPVADWKRAGKAIGRRPAVFLLLSEKH